MGYNIDPYDPIFAPVPKSHVPPPKQNEPPNVDHDPICVWFIYPLVRDEITGVPIPSRPPSQGMWDPDIILPPAAREWEYYVPCDELEDGNIYTPYCVVPKNPGPGQNIPFCARLSDQERLALSLISIGSDTVITPAILEFLTSLANRIGADDPSILATDFDFYPLSVQDECNCNKWWVGCVKDFAEDNCGDAILTTYNSFLIEELNSAQPLYYNGMIFGPGKTGYAQAQAYADSLNEPCYDITNEDGSVQYVCPDLIWICSPGSSEYDPFCYPCNANCTSESGFTTKEECECSCLPEDERPEDCVTPTPSPSPEVTPSPTPPSVTPTLSSSYSSGSPQSIFTIP